MFQVKNKITGQTVDVVYVKLQPQGTTLVPYFTVYNGDKGEWEQISATFYESENKETNFTEADVSTEQQLIDALANTNIRTINVTAPITISDNHVELSSVSNKVINGLDLTVSISDSSGGAGPDADTSHQALVLGNSDNITFNDAKITLDIDNNTTWQSAYIVQVYECNGIVFKGNTVLTGGNSAILCNDTASLLIDGTFSMIDCGFGGIELTKGVVADRFPEPSLDLSNTLTSFTYNMQHNPDKPIIYSDGITHVNIDNMSGIKLSKIYDANRAQTKYFTI